MKKLLLLGGNKFLLPVIKAAHDLGIYVITCDYIPSNIAHKFSDEYHNVSIIDKDAILNLARKLNIDDIMSFATDPGVETAAYVAEKLGLPSCGSYESVRILQNKNLFRDFLRNNNFNVPASFSYSSFEEVGDEIKDINWPVIVKPVDSAGSKGVTKVNAVEELEDAFNNAIKFSKSKTVIIEEFIEKSLPSSDTDCFSVDGNLVFCSFSNQFFDADANNPYVPSAYSWPSIMPLEFQNELKNELQRLISLLGLKTSIYNVETRVGKNGKVYIMEFSPRGGGNRLAEMLRYATGTDLIKAAVCSAVGNKIEGIRECVYKNGFWAEVILHSVQDGAYHGLQISDEIKNNVVEIDEWVKSGDYVHGFSGANEAIGTVALRFENYETALNVIENISSYIRISVK